MLHVKHCTPVSEIVLFKFCEPFSEPFITYAPLSHQLSSHYSPHITYRNMQSLPFANRLRPFVSSIPDQVSLPTAYQQAAPPQTRQTSHSPPFGVPFCGTKELTKNNFPLRRRQAASWKNARTERHETPEPHHNGPEQRRISGMQMYLLNRNQAEGPQPPETDTETENGQQATSRAKHFTPKCQLHFCGWSPMDAMNRAFEHLMQQ